MLLFQYQNNNTEDEDNETAESSDSCGNQVSATIPADIYLLKVNNRNIRIRCEICSKLTIKTPERCQWRRSAVFIVNFENILHHFLVFLLLNLNMQLPARILLLCPSYNIIIYYPANFYLFKTNNKNTRKRRVKFSNLTTKTLQQSHGRHSNVFC